MLVNRHIYSMSNLIEMFIFHIFYLLSFVVLYVLLHASKNILRKGSQASAMAQKCQEPLVLFILKKFILMYS